VYQVPDDGLEPEYDQGATQSWDVLTPHQIMAIDTDIATAVAAGPSHTLLATRRVLYSTGNNRQGGHVTHVPLPPPSLSCFRSFSLSLSIIHARTHMYMYFREGERERGGGGGGVGGGRERERERERDTTCM